MMKLLSDSHLFWDTDTRTIDPTKHMQSIVERVIERGSWEQFKEMLLYYGREEIISCIKKARYFSDKTMHFVSGYFSIPLEDLRCYTSRQLNSIPYL